MSKALIAILLLMQSLAFQAQEAGTYEGLQRNILLFGQAEIKFANPGSARLQEIINSISVYSVSNEEVKAVVSSLQLPYMKTFPLRYFITDPTSFKAVESALSVNDAMNWQTYPTYPQYDSIMHRLADTYPLYCRLDTIGESIKGRLILALKISDNVDADEDEPEVFLSSTMHGDELAGFVLMMRLAEHLLQNSESGGSQQQLIDSLEIWINPLANPDGTYNYGDTITFPTRYNSSGRDLNRNFPDPVLGNVDHEKENIAMINFLKNRSFVISANIHSGAEVLNFPWDKTTEWSDGFHPDSSWFFDICRKYVETVAAYSTPDYMEKYYGSSTYPAVVRGDDWYSVNGTRQDFVTYECSGREITLEIDETKLTPASRLDDLWNYNYRSLEAYMENAFYGIHAYVTDSENGNAVRSVVTVAGHDKDSSVVFSDSLSGFFVRLIDEGIYDIVLNADGYLTEYIEDVTVKEGEQLRLDIRLSPDDTGINDALKGRLHLYPVPAYDKVCFRWPEDVSAGLEVHIININGTCVYMDKIESEINKPLELPVANLAPGIYIVSVYNPDTDRRLKGRFVKM